MADRQWAGSTFGNGWMHECLIRCLRVMDVRVLYLFAAVFIVPFCVIFNRSGRISFAYFRQRMGFGFLKSLACVYANHYRFAQAVIDKFAMYAGRRFDVEVEGLEEFNALAAAEDGFIHLSSHIGNYEIAGYTLASDRKVINAVVYADEKASVMAGRTGMFDRTNVRMIMLKQDMSHLYEIDNALCRGEIVSFPTDRSMGGRCLECDFLGKKAKFPMGPFSVATMRGLNVLAVNVMKESAMKYRIFVTPLSYDRSLARKEQIGQLLHAYVAELEKRVRQYPEQWFNFYDFWA